MPRDLERARTESRMRYYRWMFLAAAAWNALAAGAVLFLLTNATFRIRMGISKPADTLSLQLLASCLLLFGLGYYWVSRALSKNHGLVKLGVIGKTIVFLLFFGHALTGAIPVTLAVPSVADLLFAALFLEFLVHWRREAQQFE
jgi:hypothetical protein